MVKTHTALMFKSMKLNDDLIAVCQFWSDNHQA